MKRTAFRLLFDCESCKMVVHGIITCEKTEKIFNGRAIWKDIETGEDYVLWRKGRGEFVFVSIG